MTLQVAIMFAVAAALGLVGAGLLLSLVREQPPARVYVYRMAGIMAAAAAIVLAVSAWSMWEWGTSA